MKISKIALNQHLKRRGVSLKVEKLTILWHDAVNLEWEIVTTIRKNNKIPFEAV